MFRQFGSRLIVDGRRVRDDYWEAKARRQGFTEADPAGAKRPGATKQREAGTEEQVYNAAQLSLMPQSQTPSSSSNTSHIDTSGWQSYQTATEEYGYTSSVGSMKQDVPSGFEAYSACTIPGANAQVGNLTPLGRRQLSEDTLAPPQIQMPMLTPQQKAQLASMVPIGTMSPTPTTIMSPEVFPAPPVPCSPLSDPADGCYSQHSNFGHSYTPHIKTSSWQLYQNPNGVTSVPMTAMGEYEHTYNNHLNTNPNLGY